MARWADVPPREQPHTHRRRPPPRTSGQVTGHQGRGEPPHHPATRARCGRVSSGDFERELIRCADLGDQRHQRVAQIGHRLIRRAAVSDRTSPRSNQRGRAPHPILILLKGIRHMHDSTHALSLDQPARATAVDRPQPPMPSTVTGSHGGRIVLRYVHVTDTVGRTSRHANRPILVEGDPLPVRLSRSRTIKAAK